MREIRLYDSLIRELVPVSAGDAIRVEVRTSPIVLDGGVDVVSTRPLVLFSFLERFLQREGFDTKFLFDSPGSGGMLYELSELEPPSVPVSPDSSNSSTSHGELDLGVDRELDAAGKTGGEGKGGVDHEVGRDGGRDSDRDVHDRDVHDADADGHDADSDDDSDDDDGGVDAGMSLLEVPRSDVDRWVNICFGATRDGVEADSACTGERILLSDALKQFGHPAVALYLLGTHYSLPLGDARTGLATGSKNASRIRDALEKLVPDKPSPPDMRHHMEAFRDALANDLDTPSAFVVMFEWLLEAERRGGDVGDHDLRVMLEVLELDGLAAPVG